MEILEITEHYLQGKVASREYLFEDDTMIEVDIYGEIVDMDGFMVAPESRLVKIEQQSNIKIRRRNSSNG